MKKLVLGIVAACFSIGLTAQDTFSIVAVDPETGEVGSAGASCVDLSGIPGFSDDFLGELFPGEGAINTQAWYDPTNQANAATRFEAGNTPEEIIAWLVANDVGGSPELRQYGVVRIVDGSAQSAAHTGSSTDDYKGHITGPNYSIQGNILSGSAVLDSMEARFLRSEGDLACKLMAAMQGANTIGADARCEDNGTSSLFAFLKVAQPSDEAGSPSLLVGVRTSDGDGIEPIDSLQILFDQEHDCPEVAGINELEQGSIQIYPNPASEQIQVKTVSLSTVRYDIVNTVGGILQEGKMTEGEQAIAIDNLETGIYFLRLYTAEGEVLTKEFVKD